MQPWERVLMFKREIAQAFQHVKPSWKPPHEAVFTVAKKHKKQCTINGKDATWWKKHYEDLFEDLDERLERLRIVIGKDRFILKWIDLRKVA